MSSTYTVLRQIQLAELQHRDKHGYKIPRLKYNIQGAKDRQEKRDNRLGDSCRRVEVQSEEVSLHTAV